MSEEEVAVLFIRKPGWCPKFLDQGKALAVLVSENGDYSKIFFEGREYRIIEEHGRDSILGYEVSCSDPDDISVFYLNKARSDSTMEEVGRDYEKIKSIVPERIRPDYWRRRRFKPTG